MSFIDIYAPDRIPTQDLSGLKNCLPLRANEPQRSPEIPNQLDRLEKAVVGLTERVGTLSSRLAPKVCPARQPEPTSPRDGQSYASEIGRMLADQTQIPESITEHLDWITRSLEI